MRNARWTLASLLTGTLGIAVAYALTLVLISPAHSQTGKGDAPSDGSLPPEFMKQIDGSNATGSPPPPPDSKPAAGKAADSKATEVKAPAVKPADAKPSASAPQPPPPLPPETAPAPSTPMSSPQPFVPTGAPSAAAPPAAPASGTALGREEYVYDGAGRRDPFRPYKIIRQQPIANGKPTKVEDTLEPLQRFEIDQLQVIAILWDVRQPRALVKDMDGKIHTLVKNTKLGRNNGYVAAIREGEVVVMETFDQEGGGTVKRTRTLEFKKQGRD